MCVGRMYIWGRACAQENLCSPFFQSDRAAAAASMRHAVCDDNHSQLQTKTVNNLCPSSIGMCCPIRYMFLDYLEVQFTVTMNGHPPGL